MIPSKAKTVESYLKEVPEDRKDYFYRLRETIVKNLPKDFREQMSNGMIGYVVPHELYPPGYHASPEQPLPFVSIAWLKNHIALYHMGLYAKPALLGWFVKQFSRHSKGRLDMGKSCTRFKKLEQIPFDLIGELMQKISVAEWIQTYEEKIKNRSSR